MPKNAQQGAASKGKKGKHGPSTSSSAARLVKLVTLLLFMGELGFAVVLVVDVGATLIGHVRFGDTTFAGMFAKVSDRVWDRDVPQPKAVKKQAAAAPTKAPPPGSTTSPTSKAATRAPANAPRPEDYARHLADAVDPEVQAARVRLDQLLTRF